MTHTLANGIRICTVDVSDSAHRFSVKNGDFVFLDRFGGKPARQTTKPLPPGNWTLLGRFDEITEETWKGIFLGYEEYRTIKWVDYRSYTPVSTATESARSLIPGNPMVLIEKSAKN